MKHLLLSTEQESCYKFLWKLFNILWCFHFENWYDNSVSTNSIVIDKIDSPNSKIDNYRLLTPNAFINFYQILKKLIDFYRLLSNVIDWLPRIILISYIYKFLAAIFSHLSLEIFYKAFDWGYQGQGVYNHAQGWVVRKPVNTDTGWNVNQSIKFSLIKVFLLLTFCAVWA